MLLDMATLARRLTSASRKCTRTLTSAHTSTVGGKDLLIGKSLNLLVFIMFRLADLLCRLHSISLCSVSDVLLNETYTKQIF